METNEKRISVNASLLQTGARTLSKKCDPILCDDPVACALTTYNPEDQRQLIETPEIRCSPIAATIRLESIVARFTVT